jgi:hypothetical protein
MPLPPLVGSVRTRLGASVAANGASPGSMLNAAVRSAAAPYLAVVPAGFVLARQFLADTAAALDAAAISALAPSIAFHTTDGRPRCGSRAE